jgi:hypothetical protein
MVSVQAQKAAESVAGNRVVLVFGGVAGSGLDLEWFADLVVGWVGFGEEWMGSALVELSCRG